MNNVVRNYTLATEQVDVDQERARRDHTALNLPATAATEAQAPPGAHSAYRGDRDGSRGDSAGGDHDRCGRHRGRQEPPAWLDRANRTGGRDWWVLKLSVGGLIGHERFTVPMVKDAPRYSVPDFGA